MNPSSFSAPFHTHLSGLISECPSDGGNPPGCVFYDLRKMSVLERLRALAGLTDEVRLEMFAWHSKCFTEKGGKPPRETKKKPRMSMPGLPPHRLD